MEIPGQACAHLSNLRKVEPMTHNLLVALVAFTLFGIGYAVLRLTEGRAGPSTDQ